LCNSSKEEDGSDRDDDDDEDLRNNLFSPHHQPTYCTTTEAHYRTGGRKIGVSRKSTLITNWNKNKAKDRG
jgi:hypothetical protein